MKKRIKIKGKIQRGIFKHGHRGTGVVTTEDGRDITIQRRNTWTVLPGDKVEIQMDGLRDGKIIAIVQRHQKRFVGQIIRKGKRLFVEPISKRGLKKIYIQPSQKLKISTGDWVEIEIDERNSNHGRIAGIVLRKFSQEDLWDLDFTAVIQPLDLPLEYPQKFLFAPKKLPDGSERKDLTNTLCFTIDPKTAKDFDDAVCISHDLEGNFVLNVHIADVSRYVKPNSALDKEAKRRGTSVYLGDHVIPMFPGKISNYLCSLQEGEIRDTVTVRLTIDRKGIPFRTEIFLSKIRSAKRFSYSEAQQIIDQGYGEHFDALMIMRDCARLLRKNRLENGSIDLDIPEPAIEFDWQGNPISIRVKNRLEANKIIEEFMLAANRAVTIFCRKQLMFDSHFIYRVHEKPSYDDLYDLRQLLWNLQYPALISPDPNPSDFQELMEYSKGKPEERTIKILSLRAMKKAKYSPYRLGHFGLAFADYTHFTSPIRRYPDLLVHRIVKNILAGNEKSSVKITEEIANLLSERERLAERAERQYVKLKQLRWMRSHLGEEFSGVITGLIPSGFFVELVENLCEGFVALRWLRDDFYEYISEQHLIRGNRKRREFKLGDPVEVRLVLVELTRLRADFELVESR